jgi:fer-1-like protein 6
MARLQQERKEEYEIRLIIWETREVPLVNGKSVDIFIKVLFDPTGWAGGLIEKTTDTHYASKDGRGVFNYRFKFDVSTPCEFPRLKFQIFDFGMINDEAIGESILNLKK